MMGRIFKILHDRQLQVTVASAYLIGLTALTGYLFHAFGFRVVPLITIEFLLATTLTVLAERVTSSEKSVSFFIACDLKISLAASIVLVAAGIIAFFQDARPVSVQTQHLVPAFAATLIYFGSGVLLGSNLRRLVVQLVSRALFDRPRFFTSLCLITIWFLTAAIALLPVHPRAITPFLVGVGLGISLQKGLTLRLSREVGAFRRLFEVQSGIPPTLPLSEDEREALKLLARGRNFFTKRFSTLRNHLLNIKQNGALSKRLQLIGACAWRLEGRYNDAISDTLEAANPPIDNVDAQLLLIRSLTLEDLDDSADQKIDELLSVLASSGAGRACPLTRALQARREAERSIDESGIITFTKEPLNAVVASLDLRRGSGEILEETQSGTRDEATEFFRGFVAHGVPVTPSWLLDVFGYALVVAGCHEEGRVFLQRCISLDPAYSYGYLHLGDYFLFRKTTVGIGGDKGAPGKTGAWHARACYLLAARIERSMASRVKRIAQRRLELLKKLRLEDGA